MAKLTLSGAKIEQSGPNLEHNLTEWALSGPKLGQVGTIGGGCGPRVDGTHYRRVKVDDSQILSTKSRGEVDNSQSQVTWQLMEAFYTRKDLSWTNVLVEFSVV